MLGGLYVGERSVSVVSIKAIACEVHQSVIVEVGFDVNGKFRYGNVHVGLLGEIAVAVVQQQTVFLGCVVVVNDIGFSVHVPVYPCAFAEAEPLVEYAFGLAERSVAVVVVKSCVVRYWCHKIDEPVIVVVEKLRVVVTVERVVVA